MSEQRHRGPVQRRIEAVLREEADARAPDRLLEAVFARTQAAPQVGRRPWDRVGWRPATQAPPRLLAIVALVALAVVALLPLLGGGAPAPGPAGPSPSSGPPVPSPAAIACGGASGLAGDAATLYVACPAGLQRFDRFGAGFVGPTTTSSVGLPSVGPAGAFAASTDGVVRLGSLGAPAIVARLPGVTLVASGTTRVFAVEANGRLVALDPGTGRIDASVALAAPPLALLAVGDGVWVATDDGFVRRHDGSTLAVTSEVSAGARPARLAASSVALYALSLVDGRLTRVDLAGGAVVSGNVGDPADPSALDLLVAADDGVWVTRRTDLYWIDPASLVVGVHGPLPDYPSGIVLDGGTAWVSGQTGRIDWIALPRGL